MQVRSVWDMSVLEWSINDASEGRVSVICGEGG